MTPNLSPGQTYRVHIRGQQRTLRRIFKWTEKRFGDIPCYVFTARVGDGVSGQWDSKTRQLTIRGPKVPRSEVSVPHYDLLAAEPVKTLGAH